MFQPVSPGARRRGGRGAASDPPARERGRRVHQNRRCFPAADRGPDEATLLGALIVHHPGGREPPLWMMRREAGTSAVDVPA